MAAQAGDEAARERLIAHSLRFVLRVAADAAPRTRLDRDDLISAAALGLCKAVDAYDAGRGAPFLAYARWWVRREIAAARTHQIDGVPTLPTSIQSLRAKLRAARAALTTVTGRAPTPEQLGRLLGSPDLALSLLALEAPVLALDEPLEGKDDGAVRELPAPTADPTDTPAERAATFMRAAAAAGLTLREVRILAAAFALPGVPGAGDEPVSLAEIGRRLGCTRERVRQLHAGALAKIRASAEARSWLSDLRP